MRKASVGTERTKLGKKRDPLQYSRMLRVAAFQPTESFFFVAKRDANRGKQSCRNVSLLSCLNKSCKNISRVRLPAHARIGDGKAATRQMRCLLSFGVQRHRFREFALLAIRSRQNGIQIKVIRIELEGSLAFDNGVINAVISEVGSGGDVAGA